MMTTIPWNTEEELLTLPEVAASLRLSIPTVQRWCRTGNLPAVKIGKEYRVRKSHLETWYEERRTGAGVQR